MFRYRECRAWQVSPFPLDTKPTPEDRVTPIKGQLSGETFVAHSYFYSLHKSIQIPFQGMSTFVAWKINKDEFLVYGFIILNIFV
jgi:hypothetical protein